MTAVTHIQNLVRRFEQNRDACTSGNYNEIQLRREFLDPFFSALGWDVEKKRRYAATDKQIDELVYELYGFTEEKKKIVAGG